MPFYQFMIRTRDLSQDEIALLDLRVERRGRYYITQPIAAPDLDTAADLWGLGYDHYREAE